MSAATDEALKKKFQQLQQQQQERLLRRKELKQQQRFNEQSQKSGFALVDSENTQSSFGVKDDLDLKLEDPLPKSASYVSEELIEHLNEQITELRDENGRLFKLLSERDFDIRQLKKKQEEDRLALVGSSQLSSDSAASKIVELSKKVRELSAALEAKKTEAKQLFSRCRQLENELSNKENVKLSPRLGTVTAIDDSPRSHISEADSKALQERLRVAEQRNAEYRNQVQALKQELKVAQKVIANEVGEGVTMQELLSSNSAWRGRAQQIMALQKKVAELKQVQDQQTVKTSRSGDGVDDLEAEMMGTQLKKADMKHRETIRKLEKERKEMLERSAAELQALEADYAALKQKQEASKARNLVLTNENKSMKAEMQKLIDKGNHDDELISALIAQQNSMKQMLENLSHLQKQTVDSQQEKMSAMSAKNQHESNIVQQLKSIVAEKESKVKTLELELMQLKNSKVQESQLNSMRGLYERPPTASRADGQTTQALVVEDVSYPSHEVIQSNSKHNSRPPTADKCSPTSFPSRPGSRHTAQVKASSEKNEELLVQEYQSLAQAAHVERDRLMELLQLSQRRLDEASEKLLQYQSEAKQHKQTAVALEKKLGKLRLESASTAKSSSGVQRKKDAAAANKGSAADLRQAAAPEGLLEELEVSLSIQKDENEALKAALESTLQAKAEDLRLYNQMIEQTKLVFLEGLRQFKLTNGS